MAKTLIVPAHADGFDPLSIPQRENEIARPLPKNLDTEQRDFWRWFPSQVTLLGELRRKIGLTRREWYYPTDNPRYHKLANLSEHLKNEPERVKQLLEDDAALLAYIATLRLQGA